MSRRTAVALRGWVGHRRDLISAPRRLVTKTGGLRSSSCALGLSPGRGDVARRDVDAPDRRQLAGGGDDRGLLAAATRAHEADLVRRSRPARTFYIGGHRPGRAMRA